MNNCPIVISSTLMFRAGPCPLRRAPLRAAPVRPVRVISTLAALSALLLPAVGRAQDSPQRPHVNVVVSGAVATRTASHNEVIDGRFRTVAVQTSRPLFTVGPMQVAWLGELTPVMLVTAGAPPNRIPTAATDAAEAGDPVRLARYQIRDGYGIGVAPLGAEAAFALSGRTHLLVNVTSGVAWFSQVVPYGKATQANFTVAPGLWLERHVGERQAFAVGYQLHHLSNASMGGANPGMNSHIFSMRLSRRR